MEDVTEELKDKAGSALLGKLIVLLAQNEGIRQALSELPEAEADRILDDVVAGVQRLLQSVRPVSYLRGSATSNQAPAPSPEPPITAPLKPATPAPEERAKTLQDLLFGSAAAFSQAAGVGVSRPPAGSPAPPIPPVPPPGEKPPRPSVNVAASPAALPVSVPPVLAPPAVTPRGDVSQPTGGASVPRRSASSVSAPSPSAPPAGGSGPLKDLPASKPIFPEATILAKSAGIPMTVQSSVPDDPLPAHPEKLSERTEDSQQVNAGTWRRSEEKRTTCTFEDDLAYVHAVALIPYADSSSAEPFLIDESGLEDERRIMVVDLAGLRFYLSLIRTDAPSVSKSGLLLLAKQDALRLRYDHERVLNNLRLRGSLLPAEFGTVVRGRDELMLRVEFRHSALLELVVQLSAVERWQLTASVLDAKLVRTISGGGGTSHGSSHEGGRSRGTVGGERLDVQTLERLLNREKKLAQSILESVAGASDRHTVEFQIGLGGGMSDDWKPILRGGFTVSTAHLPRFHQAIVEAQNLHPLEEPMLHLTGTTESFSLSM